MEFNVYNLAYDISNFNLSELVKQLPVPPDGNAEKFLGFTEDGTTVSSALDVTVGDASETEKGILMLAGDLSGSALEPRLKKPADGAASSLLGFDVDGVLVSTSTSGVPDSTTTEKGILMLAGDLTGTADLPKIQKPATGIVDVFAGFDAAGSLTVSTLSDFLPDSTTTEKGILMLAGDLTGTADLPKIQKPATGIVDVFAGFDAAGSLTVSSLPDSTTSEKGILMLAGDLTGTADLPKIQKPATGTIDVFAGFDAAGSLTVSSLPDSTTTEKGILMLAGDLTGTADLPKIQKPATGTIDVFAGFDAAGSLTVSSLPDSTTSEKGILMLAGDLTGTADLPKIQKPATGTIDVFAGFDAAGSLTVSSLPDSTTTEKGILMLAGDLTGTADLPKIQKPATGTIDVFAGFDAAGSLTVSSLPDSTTSEKGILMLAGDLTGTADLPKIQKPATGTIDVFAGFDAAGSLTVSSLPDSTTTEKGILMLAGDLTGTSDLPKIQKPATGTIDVFAGFDAAGSLTVSSLPDSTTTEKGILMLAGDLTGTADLPKIQKPATGTIDVFAGFDAAGSLTVSSLPDSTTSEKGILMLAGDLTGTSDLPKIQKPAIDSFVDVCGFTETNVFSINSFANVIPKRIFLRQFINPVGGTILVGTGTMLLNGSEQLTTYNGNPIDTSTYEYVSTGTAHIKEILSSPRNMKQILIRVTINSSNFPFDNQLLLTLFRRTGDPIVAQTVLATSSAATTLSGQFLTFVVGSTDVFVTDGYFLGIVSQTTAVTYSSYTITITAIEDII